MGRHPARVHASGCTMGGKGWRMRALTWEAAVRALGVDQGPACPYCSPDAALGMLDWPASRRLEAWTVRRSSYTGSRRRAGGGSSSVSAVSTPSSASPTAMRI
ncbi:DUF6233 domain-containing protein [Streptomyces sp. NPDC090054]|uniref:DUF6233 domain-containing protein n=1 Tax=Streptomyces sp. NPDC090054 TaxID=3365933 RepID=UPI0037F7D205